MGKNLKIVGVDASLTSTGVAVAVNGGYWTDTIQSKKRGAERLIEIRKRIRDVVKKADLVALEGYAFARPNQAHQIGELGGVLRVLLAEMSVPWVEVAPAAVKKFATGKGNAKKEQVAVGVYKKWGKEFGTNDEADAFVLAKIAQACICGTDELNAYQSEIVKKVNKTRQQH